MPNLFMDGQYQCGGVFCTVPEGVLADLVRRVIVGPQHIGNGRVAVRQLEPDAVALLELEGVRLDADLELGDLAGLDRLGIGMGAIGLHLGAVPRICLLYTSPSPRD